MQDQDWDAPMIIVSRDSDDFFAAQGLRRKKLVAGPPPPLPYDDE
jgi:hypothetical protein